MYIYTHQAAAIGGRAAGDECEELPLRRLLRKADLVPKRYDWRDDGLYGGVCNMHVCVCMYVCMYACMCMACVNV
jgi:hypothetical protein